MNASEKTELWVHANYVFFSSQVLIVMFFYQKFFLYNNRTCCIIMIMNDACDDVARVRDEREKIHQYRTERERARTLLSYVKRIP